MFSTPKKGRDSNFGILTSKLNGLRLYIWRMVCTKFKLNWWVSRLVMHFFRWMQQERNSTPPLLEYKRSKMRIDQNSNGAGMYFSWSHASPFRTKIRKRWRQPISRWSLNGNNCGYMSASANYVMLCFTLICSLRILIHLFKGILQSVVASL